MGFAALTAVHCIGYRTDNTYSLERGKVAMSKSIDKKFLHPRYWLTWLGVLFIWLLAKLPWRLQLLIGKGIGLLMYQLLPSRRKVCCINLELAFPELSLSQRKALAKDHFISLGRGVMEATYSWWGNTKKIKALTQIEGYEHLTHALNKGKGVILLSAHFTSLELGGRMLALVMPTTPLHVVYRSHQNKLIEALVTKLRDKRYGKAIPKNNIRDMIRSLKDGFPVWYAQDQSYLGKHSLNVPFFGVDAATNPGTSRITAMTGATIIPFFTVRATDKKEGYLLRFLTPLEDFPSNDIMADTIRINQLIETQIREFPDQYLWTHKRYKTTNNDFYKSYMNQHPETSCK